MKCINNRIIYEVGDWVTCIDNCGAMRNYKVGDVSKVSYIGEDILRTENSTDTGMYPRRFRLSTQEEINKATEEEKIMIGGLEVKFLKRVTTSAIGNIRVGCETINKELYLKIGKKAGWL